MKDFQLTLSSLGWLVTELTKLLQSTNKKYRVSVKEWSEKRSLPANAQCHVWYPVIAKHIGSDAKTVKSRCKIDFGLPIILGNDSEYSKVLSYMLDKSEFFKMNFEQQEKFIGAVKITSKMSTKECNEYRDNLRLYWFNNGLELKYRGEL